MDISKKKKKLKKLLSLFCSHVYFPVGVASQLRQPSLVWLSKVSFSHSQTLLSPLRVAEQQCSWEQESLPSALAQLSKQQ